MPMHSLLSLAAYLDQFCFSVSCAVVSSARQAFLSRPRTTDPIPAATQLVSTLSVGGPPARARTFCPRDGPPARGIGRLFVPRDIGGQILDGWLPMSDRCLRQCGPNGPSGACSEGDYRDA